jgi:hypothetical protein
MLLLWLQIPHGDGQALAGQKRGAQLDFNNLRVVCRPLFLVDQNDVAVGVLADLRREAWLLFQSATSRGGHPEGMGT